MRTIKLSVSGRGETDAPTVEDLLDQIRDYFAILSGVEQAIAEDGIIALEWRVIHAASNSPISIEAGAFSKHYAVNVERRADVVTRATAVGMSQLVQKKERPRYFTDDVLKRAEKVFERVTNGLDQTFVDYGPDLPSLQLTPVVARAAAANAKSVLTPPERAYKELGSIEGTTRAIDRDGYGRLLLYIHTRLTGEDVKCIVRGEAEKKLGEYKVKEIWRNRRVRVYGTLHFKALGRLANIEALEIKFLRDRAELPDIEDILDPDFTGGLRSEEYLARLRDGGTS